MSNAGRFVVTHFNETNWDFWGLSWLGSLVDLGKYQGNVVIVDFGLSERQRRFLENINVTLLPVVEKYKVPELDLLHTLAAYSIGNKGTYAYWDHVSYFQDDITGVFDLANDALVCCKESNPQPTLKPSLESFGLKEEVTPDSFRLFTLLKKVSRKYGRPLNGDFFVCQHKLLPVLEQFNDCCFDMELVNPVVQTNRVTLNLFANSFDLVHVADDIWNKRIGNDLSWDDGFWEGDNKVKVINIPPNMQYSADSAFYHFRNKYPDLFSKWVSFYKGNSFAPKRVMKPRLKKK